jgi:hypothetical protein
VPAFVDVELNVTELPAQTVVVDVLIEVVGERLGLTIIVITLLVACDIVTQLALLFITTFTWSLLFKLEEVNVGLFVPALLLFTSQK